MSLSALSKDQVIFDPSDKTTIGDSDNIGSFTRSGESGALITNHNLIRAAGPSFDFADGDVTVGTDTINETAHGYSTGELVQLTTTGVLPAGLALVTDYYVIRVDDDNFKLAASPLDAECEVAVDITAAAGGGVHTVTGFAQDARHLDVYSATADGEGNPISSTGGSLNVNLTNSPIFDVNLDGVYSGGNTDPDNTGLIAHVRAAAPADAEQTYRSTGASPSADDVDPANVHALDVNSFGMAWDGSAWDRITSSGGALDFNFASQDADIQVQADLNDLLADDEVDAGGSLKIGFRADDVLTAVSADGDRVDGVADLYRRQWVNNGADISMTHAAVAVDDTAGGTQLKATALACRRNLLIQNLDSKPIYIGLTGVTSANGIRVGGKQSMMLDVGPHIDVYALGDAGVADVRVMELG